MFYCYSHFSDEMAKEYKVAGCSLSLPGSRYTSMSGEKQRKWDDKPGLFILRGIPQQGR
jgi:hypothetical protein